MLKKAQTKFHFSKIEVHDLIKAWIILSLAFTIYFLGGFELSYSFLIGLGVSFITVGTAFVFHELGHKLLAQHYGCFAEFRAFNGMLWFALIMSFLGIIFAAPGAVMINGPIGTRRNGKISALGPGTNIILAIIFLLIIIFFDNNISDVIGYFGFMVNSLLALFNMLPLPMFDGKKIWQWNKFVYILMMVISIFLMIIQNQIK